MDKILLEFAQKMQALTESSLTRVMNDPLGHKLAQYLHTTLGIPDQVEVKPVPLDYMKTAAWTTGMEYVVFKGKKGWVLREPNSAVPVAITDDNPVVRKVVQALPDGKKWEDVIEPVAVFSIIKPRISDKVLARPNRQRAGKAPELAISHRLLTPEIVSSIIRSAKIDLKRWNQKRVKPWKPETIKSWISWLDGLEEALVEGENEIMLEIDWKDDEDHFDEAEDFWNHLVLQSIRKTNEWKAATVADREEISKKYPDSSAAFARGINVPRTGSHTQTLIKNTVFLQLVKNLVVDQITDFVSSNELV